jgi:hypothetical protein
MKTYKQQTYRVRDMRIIVHNKMEVQQFKMFSWYSPGRKQKYLDELRDRRETVDNI